MFMVMYMDVDWKGTQKLNVIWSAGFMSILKFKVFFIFFPTLCFGMLTSEINPHQASFLFFLVAILN